MKVIKYQVLGYMGVWNPETDEVEQKECLADKERPYTEEAYQKALAEAYSGEVTVEEVADPETPDTPTGDDSIWADMAAAIEEGVNDV